HPLFPPQRPAHRAVRNPRPEWKERASRRALPLALESLYKLAIAPHDMFDRMLASDLLGAPGDQRVPEAGASHCEADESWHCGCGCEPIANLSIIFSASQDDAPNAVAAAPPCRGNDLFAIFASIET